MGQMSKTLLELWKREKLEITEQRKSTARIKANTFVQVCLAILASEDETACAAAGEPSDWNNSKVLGSTCSALEIYDSASTGWMNVATHIGAEGNVMFVQSQNIMPENGSFRTTVQCGRLHQNLWKRPRCATNWGCNINTRPVACGVQARNCQTLKKKKKRQQRHFSTGRIIKERGQPNWKG